MSLHNTRQATRPVNPYRTKTPSQILAIYTILCSTTPSQPIALYIQKALHISLSATRHVSPTALPLLPLSHSHCRTFKFRFKIPSHTVELYIQLSLNNFLSATRPVDPNVASHFPPSHSPFTSNSHYTTPSQPLELLYIQISLQNSVSQSRPLHRTFAPQNPLIHSTSTSKFAPKFSLSPSPFTSNCHSKIPSQTLAL